MRRRPPRSTRTDTLFPYTTLFRSHPLEYRRHIAAGGAERDAGRARAGLYPRLYVVDPAVPHDAGVSQFPRGARTADVVADRWRRRSEEHTSELQSLMRLSYAVFCLKKKTYKITVQR